MTVRGVLRLVAMATATLPAACTPTVDTEADLWALYQADEAYSEAMDAGDVEAIVALYAADATRYPPDGDPVTGTEAMRAFAERVAATPGFTLRAWPIALQVSGDGAMGFTLNHVELTVASEDGAPMVQWLRDAHTWRKEADGVWRIVEDIWHVMEVPPSVGALLSGPDVAVTSLGYVDLMGDPVAFDHSRPGDLPAAIPPGAQVPVQVLAVRWEGGEAGSSTRLVVASADTRSPSFLMDEEVEAAFGGGGGFSALSEVRFESDGEGEPLTLVVLRGWSPDDGGGAVPGAPADVRWRLVDGVYEEVEG